MTTVVNNKSSNSSGTTTSSSSSSSGGEEKERREPDDDDHDPATSVVVIDDLRIQYLIDDASARSNRCSSSSSNGNGTKNENVDVRIIVPSSSRLSSPQKVDEDEGLPFVVSASAGGNDSGSKELPQPNTKIQTMVRISPTATYDDDDGAVSGGAAGAACGAGPWTPNNMKLFDIIFLDGDDVDSNNEDSSSDNNNNDNNDTTTSSISIVRLKDLEQRLQGYLLPYFQLVQGYETVDMESVKSEIMPLMQKGCTGGMCPHVSLKTMHDSAAEGNVECHTVNISSSTTCTSDDGGDVDKRRMTTTSRSRTKRRRVITKLKLYYDDSAHLKRRPLNDYVMKNLVVLAGSSSGGGADGDDGDDGDGGKGGGNVGENDDESQLKIHGDVFVVAVGYYEDDEDEGDEGDDQINSTNLNESRPRRRRRQETHLVSCYPNDILKL